jgi:hypothetical protein
LSETKDTQELDLDKKVTVRSIADWTTGFSRKYDGFGDISIAPGGSARISRAEVIAQVQSGNRLFTGIDGFGSHATVYIEDAPTRVEVGFDSDDGSRKQNVFSENMIKELFSIKTMKSFEPKFMDAVKTRAEMQASVNAIKRLKLNDFDKIRFVENYTGYKL